MVKRESNLGDSDQESSFNKEGILPDYEDDLDHGSFVDEEVAGNESDFAYADSDS